eukprot:TRINITY_DN3550_c0_g1_i1.p2 TRINITY_DN3550_c0_g1~~TRINITY_DN3550_c0_g1_i1.p2  ORF type:complete len:140 (-),score=41.52 TRINITY_DN3550_c0_g1_i1:68-487(-)
MTTHFFQWDWLRLPRFQYVINKPSPAKRALDAVLIAAGLYAPLHFTDRFYCGYFIGQDSLPRQLTLFEKAVYYFVPNDKKLNEQDMLKLYWEAKMEYPYRGVDVFNYRLKSKRTPDIYFSEWPPKYVQEKQEAAAAASH